MTTPEKIFEVNKDMELTSMMQLVDLNGTMVNFQSDFTITSDDNILVAIVNQQQLDNGDIKFERVKGTYSRRVSYQDNEHQNHYIAIKCEPSQTGKCHVTIRLQQLPPAPQRKRQRNTDSIDERDEQRRVHFNDDVNSVGGNGGGIRGDIRQDIRGDIRQDIRGDIRQERPDMRPDMRPDIPDISTRNDINTRPEQPLTTLSPSIKQEIHDQLINLHQQEDYADKDDESDKDEKVKDKKPRNPYYLFGMVCLLVCFIIISYRILGKKK